MNQAQLDRSVRILIVEDEGLIADDISRRLKKLGFEVAGISASGEEAIQKVGELRPGLILMDIRLSGEMDGIEAANQIQKTFDVPIVFLTAHTDQETMERAQRTGPFGYLTKPLQQHSLPATIDIALYKHRVERELREQRAWLSTILSSMGDAVAVADAEGSVQYLNSAAEKMTGWSRAEAMAQPLSSVLAGSNLESKAQIEDLVAEMLEHAQPGRLPRGLLVAQRSGQTSIVDGEIAPSLDNGGLMGAVLTFRDATVRELEEQHRRHEHKIRAVGTLAAGVAHDFNNLLMVISGYADELELSEHDAAGQQAVAQIKKAAQSAAAITSQLLRFSRKQQVQRRDLDANEVVREAEPLLRKIAGLKVIVELRLCLETLRLNADPDQLLQILMNLTANARDAMPDGGVVTIETGTFSVEDAPFEAKRQGVILAVKDTGPGMSEEVIDRLFEPYFTTKDPGKGTGLGLSIVHSIVNDLGGVILVESSPENGSLFLVYLPQTEAVAQVAAQPPQAGDGRLRQRTVLLVDDDETVRELITAYLATTNYKVLTAPGGEDALTIAESYPETIDALITDLMMPEMTGLQLASEFRRRGLTSRTIFISGFADQTLRSMGDLPAGSVFLPKPFHRKDLIRELARLLLMETTTSTAA